MADLITVDTLSLAKGGKGDPLWTAAQYVEPERFGDKWCDWDQAEEMLVLAALPLLKGQAAISAKSYKIDRDEKAMTLTLSLYGG